MPGLVRRSSSRTMTNRSSLTADARIRSMAATPANLHKYLDEQRRRAADKDGQTPSEDFYSPITRNSSFRLAGGEAAPRTAATSISEDDDGNVDQEWGLNRQRANTNEGTTTSASDYHVDGHYDTASGDSDSDSEAGGKRSKSRGGQRVYVSNVPANRNVALTPWGTPVENLESPKTRKLDRVPSMPLGKLLPTSNNDATAPGKAVDESSSSALHYSKQNSFRATSMTTTSSRTTKEDASPTPRDTLSDQPLTTPKYKAGYLLIHGGSKSMVGRKTFVTRYVVLEKGIVRYYESKADYDAGRPCVKGTTINATLAAFRDDDDGDFAFLITSKQPGVRPYLFRASSEEERRSWQDAFMSWNLAHVDLPTMQMSRPSEWSPEERYSEFRFDM